MANCLWITGSEGFIPDLVQDVVVKTDLIQAFFICFYGLCFCYVVVERFSCCFIHFIQLWDLAAFLSDFRSRDYKAKLLLQSIRQRQQEWCMVAEHGIQHFKCHKRIPILSIGIGGWGRLEYSNMK